MSWEFQTYSYCLTSQHQIPETFCWLKRTATQHKIPEELLTNTIAPLESIVMTTPGLFRRTSEIHHDEEKERPIFIQDQDNTMAYCTIHGKPLPQKRPMFRRGEIGSVQLELINKQPFQKGLATSTICSSLSWMQ